jgi:hypothetical protein
MRLRSTSFRRLVDLAKMRWRIERDYQELKQEIGLGHYEGRGWPGFHHHGTLCIAAYGFLISVRETIPPSGPHSNKRLKKPAIPNSYRPRGAADPAPTARPQLDRDPASKIDRGNHESASHDVHFVHTDSKGKRVVLYDAVRLIGPPFNLGR